MLKWELRYHPEVETWLEELTAKEIKAVAKLLLFLQRVGNRLGLPHSKALGDGLFELRDKSFGYRIYYTFQKGQCVVLLCAGDKGSQERDIKKARKRLGDLG